MTENPLENEEMKKIESGDTSMVSTFFPEHVGESCPFIPGLKFNYLIYYWRKGRLKMGRY